MNTNPLLPVPISARSLTNSGQGQSQLREQSESRNQLAPRKESKPPATYIHRGKVEESEAGLKHYRPQSNQQIAPQNRLAINDYESTNRGGRASRSVGLILDRYI